jgi:hypothetical protein
MNTSIVRKLSYFLSMMLVVALISCGGKKTEDEEAEGEAVAEGEVPKPEAKKDDKK